LSNRFYDPGPTASGQKVLLATTAYDSPDASYTFSIARSREALSAAGVQSGYYLLQGNCHVDDARNAVVRDFLESDCTELIFLDADVSWEPDALVDLCKIDRDLVGGVYPYRRESEEETMPVRHLPEIKVDGDLIEVEGLPTGFMKIKRHVLETMAATAKHYLKDDGKPHPVLFERDYFGGGRRGGDIRFCMVWRDMGGKVYAAPELRLGHCGKMVLKDSLGASLRRQTKTSLRWMALKIKEGAKLDTFIEATKAYKNHWGASADVLQIASGLAKASQLPILEMGSGLSTIVLAASTEQQVWAVEHDPRYAADIEEMAGQAGVKNIALASAGLKDGWYDLEAEMPSLPAQFGLAFVDGPPRVHGTRMKFFETFGHRCEVILCDDADDAAYAKKLKAWAEANGRKYQSDGRAAVIHSPTKAA
jgi:predicted O-methyltransferase YrrM